MNPLILSPHSGVIHICVHKQKKRNAMFAISIIGVFFSLSMHCLTINKLFTFIESQYNIIYIFKVCPFARGPAPHS